MRHPRQRMAAPRKSQCMTGIEATGTVPRNNPALY
jgi:hypothetical protein